MLNRSAAARQLGVSRDALARWERAGLARVQRDENDLPGYLDEEVARIAQALHTGELVAPGRQPRRASPQGGHLALVPPAQLRAQPVAQVDDLHTLTAQAQVLPGTEPGAVDDVEVRALRVAEAKERAEAARIAAEVARIQAEAMRDEVLHGLRLHQRRRRVDEIVARALVGVPEADRDLTAQLVREQLGALDDLDAGADVAATVEHAVGEVRARNEAERWAVAERLAEQQQAHHARQAAHVAAAHAATHAAAAKAAESQAIGAANAQRAQAIAGACAAEAASQGVPNWIAEAVGHAAWRALAQLDATTFANDGAAFFHARRGGLEAAAMAWSSCSPPTPPPQSRGSDGQRHRRQSRG